MGRTCMSLPDSENLNNSYHRLGVLLLENSRCGTSYMVSETVPFPLPRELTYM